MSDFVLIHGGWAGGWQWEETAEVLARKGHRVATPTVTGMGERHHLARPDIGLKLHVTDIENTIRYRNLNNVILVGFSYGGMVATGVASGPKNGIAKLVYLDAFVPKPGESLFEIFGPKITKSLAAAIDTFGDGWRIPFFDVYDERLTDQPIKTGQERLHFSQKSIDELENCYIDCTAKEPEWSFTPVLRRVAREFQQRGGICFTFESGHFPMHSHPEQLADMLHEIATHPIKELKYESSYNSHR